MNPGRRLADSFGRFSRGRPRDHGAMRATARFTCFSQISQIAKIVGILYSEESGDRNQSIRGCFDAIFIANGQWADASGGLPSGRDPIVGYFVEFENVVSVPEPPPVAMFGLALGLLGLTRRKSLA